MPLENRESLVLPDHQDLQAHQDLLGLRRLYLRLLVPQLVHRDLQESKDLKVLKVPWELPGRWDNPGMQELPDLQDLRGHPDLPAYQRQMLHPFARRFVINYVLVFALQMIVAKSHKFRTGRCRF